MPHALVTGIAGFIGFHVVRQLLDKGWSVAGVDSFTENYDPALKRARFRLLVENPAFHGEEIDICNMAELSRICDQKRPDVVIHLAAEAGVRRSVEVPKRFLEANVMGSYNILELARKYQPRHTLMASTSSVYGANEKLPFHEVDKTDHPVSFYAATKKSVEIMAHSWAHIYQTPITQFRFFTVYGPWGRPDMALFLFTKAILENRPIDIYNNGNMERDFTYIDDLVAGITALIDHVPSGGPSNYPGDSQSPVAPFRVVNIGNSNKVKLMDFVAAIEKAVGRTARKNFLPMQQGDVHATWADTSLLGALVGTIPNTPVEEGVASFVHWYRNYFDM